MTQVGLSFGMSFFGKRALYERFGDGTHLPLQANLFMDLVFSMGCMALSMTATDEAIKVFGLTFLGSALDDIIEEVMGTRPGMQGERVTIR